MLEISGNFKQNSTEQNNALTPPLGIFDKIPKPNKQTEQDFSDKISKTNKQTEHRDNALSATRSFCTTKLICFLRT